MADESACKPDSVPPKGGGGHPSGTAVADSLVRSTREHRVSNPFAQIDPEVDPLDLAPGGVCRAAPVTRCAGGLLHHRFTLTDPKTGGLFSVALSRGSPRVGVTHHPARWSPDFPRRLRGAGDETARPTRPPPTVTQPNGRGNRPVFKPEALPHSGHSVASRFDNRGPREQQHQTLRGGGPQGLTSFTRVPRGGGRTLAGSAQCVRRTIPWSPRAARSRHSLTIASAFRFDSRGTHT